MLGVLAGQGWRGRGRLAGGDKKTSHSRESIGKPKFPVNHFLGSGWNRKGRRFFNYL
jgi:hypothetical protein